ncbi:MAG: hypothetical protein JWM41_4845 [Gemmatimonadetes bacterium]|nr:hypothetical protein [Gemmatimonadota bacterium]
MTCVSRGASRRPSLSLLWGAVALVLSGALPAVAQDPDPLSKLDPSSKFAVELLIDSANTLGLPSDYLRSTALQGIALKVDGKRIVVECRKKFNLLKTAHAILGSVGGEELKAGASVLYAGAKPNQLAPFKARQQNRNDLEAFTIWADLITRGVPSEEASSAITKLWQDGADDATFYGLWNNVQSDILKGLNPGAAFQNRIRETPGRPTANKVTPPEGQENQSSR